MHRLPNDVPARQCGLLSRRYHAACFTQAACVLWMIGRLHGVRDSRGRARTCVAGALQRGTCHEAAPQWHAPCRTR